MRTWYKIVKTGMLNIPKEKSGLYHFLKINNLIIDESEKMVFAFQSIAKDNKKTIVVYFK